MVLVKCKQRRQKHYQIGCRNQLLYTQKPRAERSRNIIDLQRIEKEAKEPKYNNLISILPDINTPSISLLEKAGFKKWGQISDVAEFWDTTCGQ